MADSIIKKVATIDARPAEVWDALTNPEKTRRYFFRCRVESTWKPGDPIVFKGRIFLVKKIELRGKILEIDPGKLLRYELQHRDASGHSTVTFELISRNGKTLLFTCDDVGEGPGAEQRMKRSQRGWSKILKGLKKVAEERMTKATMTAFIS